MSPRKLYALRATRDTMIYRYGDLRVIAIADRDGERFYIDRPGPFTPDVVMAVTSPLIDSYQVVS